MNSETKIIFKHTDKFFETQYVADRFEIEFSDGVEMNLGDFLLKLKNLLTEHEITVKALERK